MTMKKQNNKKHENKQSQLTEEINYIERLINDDDYIDSYGEGLLNNIKAKLTNHKQLTNKKHWYSVDKDAQLVEWLEDNFSLHDVDMIYNVLQEFRDIDTKQGEITFNDFINKNY